MTGNNLFLIIMMLQAAVAFALQPIPPAAAPERGLTNENDNITVVDLFTEPGISTMPIESTADSVRAVTIQNKLTRQIPATVQSPAGRLKE